MLVPAHKIPCVELGPFFPRHQTRTVRVVDAALALFVPTANVESRARGIRLILVVGNSSNSSGGEFLPSRGLAVEHLVAVKVKFAPGRSGNRSSTRKPASVPPCSSATWRRYTAVHVCICCYHRTVVASALDVGGPVAAASVLFSSLKRL